MGKVAKRVGLGIGTLGLTEVASAIGAPRLDKMLLPDPVKPDKMPKPLAQSTDANLAAARADELEERKRRRISLITSPGGAFLTATDLSRPRLLGQ